MSPINQNSVNDKLFRLSEAIKIIEELLTKPDLITDEILKTSLLFNMIISVEIILDIGNHILAEVFNKPENTYRDIILQLGKKKVIDPLFAEANKDMGDFRNRVVHDYDKVDDKMVYEYAQNAPKIFKTFANNFIEFLKNN